MHADQGYYQQPTIHGDQVVFVADDELWTVSAEGGIARQLTVVDGRCGQPQLSPDGTLLAFVCNQTGNNEVWVMPAQGGEARQLTWFGAGTAVSGWLRDGRVLVATNAFGSCGREQELVAVAASDGQYETLNLGPAMTLAEHPSGTRLLGRHTLDAAWWKRYRGGTAGDLWMAKSGSPTFSPVFRDQPGQHHRPLVVGNRFWFVSDHEGIANLYSCTATGRNLHRESDEGTYYVRHPATDGKRVVYQAGGDLRLIDPAADTTTTIAIDFATARPQRRARTVAVNVSDADVSHDGKQIVFTARGRLFAGANWAGPLRQLGEANGVRYGFPRWLKDGKRVVVACDRGGEEHLEVLNSDGSPLAAAKRGPALTDLPTGQIKAMCMSSQADQVAIAGEANDLVIYDLAKAKRTVVRERSTEAIDDPAWSPDGRWLAFSQRLPGPGRTRQALFIYDTKQARVRQVTEPLLSDVMPSWDPKGRWLLLTSVRRFQPEYDELSFDLGFVDALEPCLLTLRPDVLDPFVRQINDSDDDDDDGDKPAVKSGRAAKPRATKAAAKGKTAAKRGKRAKADADQPDPIEIDFSGISARLRRLPLEADGYGAVFASEDHLCYQVESDHGWDLKAWDLKSYSESTLIEGVGRMQPSANGKYLVVWTRQGLAVASAGGSLGKGDDSDDKPGKGGRFSPGSGLIDVDRCPLRIDPASEWQQIYAEAWRMQRDHFWTADMSGVRWSTVFKRYQPLVDRIGSRHELNDLLWEMQGELGTSHAYAVGGDARRPAPAGQGFLGVDWRWNARAKAWVIDRILAGDDWQPQHSSPLRRLGLDIRDGDQVLAIAGRELSADWSPARALYGLAGCEVELRLRRRTGAPARSVVVQPLASEHGLRYRDWVEQQRSVVHQATKGRVGYIHIPDMGGHGFAEFHRHYLAEFERDGLIVDVRYNGGGHISPLLLEKLARRRIGVDISRHDGDIAYPYESPRGPLVCLTNQFAGSDGDIFSHCFKLMKLGPLIGTRTWGGVIGISPRRWLVDGGMVTQPEYSFHFDDVGWAVENYGTDPDIEIDNQPHDHRSGIDQQMAMALETISERLPAKRAKPKLSPKPKLPLPRLPPR